MSSNKRFYWIKLKTDFFNQDTIDFLLSQENGCEYIVLYQMLCLNTANNNGELSTNIGEMIVPYDVKKIVRDTKYFSIDTVTIALGLFKRLGLIYEEENKILKIKDFNEMVGSETSSARRVREWRKNKEIGVLHCNKNVTQEIEIEKDIDIYINNKKENNKKKKVFFENNEVNILFLEFLELRKKIKAVNSERAINTLIKQLENYPDNIKYKMIENSIVNSWKSIYPLKEIKSYKSEIKPDWYGKNIKEEKMTNEEIEKLEKRLKSV